MKHLNLILAAAGVAGMLAAGPAAHAAVSPSLDTGTQISASEEAAGRPDSRIKLPGRTDGRAEGAANERQTAQADICFYRYVWVQTSYGPELVLQYACY